MDSKFKLGEEVIVFSDGISKPKTGNIVDIDFNEDRNSFEYLVAFKSKKLKSESSKLKFELNVPEYKILKKR